MQYFIDFTNISSAEELYTVLANELEFPEYFGRNEDALWDVLTGDMELPAEIRFIDVSPEKAEQFQSIISVFEDAANELGDEMSFFLHIINKTDHDDEAAG